MNYLLYRPAFKSAEKVCEASSLTPLQNTGNYPTEGLVFRWGCISELPGGLKTVNSAKAIRRVATKGSFRLSLASEGLSMTTYGDFGDMLDVAGVTDFQWIVRPSEHQRSENLFFCPTLKEVYKAVQKPVMNEGYYISQYIPKVAEYRALVVSGRIIAMIRKLPVDQNAVSWGCVQQGDFEYVGWSEWPKAVSQNALGAMKASGLVFGAVDVILDGQGKAYCLEVNTAPHLTPYYAKCFGKAFDYIVANTKDDIPVTGESWRHLIHPAISGEAL